MYLVKQTAFMILSLSMCSIAFASNTVTANNIRFYISYVDHPMARSFYIPLLQSTYDRAGIKVKFIPVTPARAQQQLAMGKSDAVLLIERELVNTIPYIVPIEPTIDVGEITLICTAGLPCTEAQLNDENLEIIFPKGVKVISTLLTLYKANFNAISGFEIIPKLLEKHRVDYAITLQSQSHNTSNPISSYQRFVLKKMNFIHALHSRHTDKQTQISEALRLTLANSRRIDTPKVNNSAVVTP
jgi:hypothetical protein